jgi:hypothetical protein
VLPTSLLAASDQQDRFGHLKRKSVQKATVSLHRRTILNQASANRSSLRLTVSA